MLAKCGEVRVWHWAHQTKRVCDTWWENEGEWHRAWKNQFPPSWQEIVHPAENGVRHIADVKTDQGWVIEFQHSPIKPEERRSRDAFYGKLVWVVDGMRRKRDKAQFMRAWEDRVRTGSRSELMMLCRYDCALLREWAESQGPIFFDFGEEQTLWWLVATPNDTWVYVCPFPRAELIKSLHALDFGGLVSWANSEVAGYESKRRALASPQVQIQPLVGFTHYLAQMRRSRRRL